VRASSLSPLAKVGLGAVASAAVLDGAVVVVADLCPG